MTFPSTSILTPPLRVCSLWGPDCVRLSGLLDLFASVLGWCDVPSVLLSRTFSEHMWNVCQPFSSQFPQAPQTGDGMEWAHDVAHTVFQSPLLFPKKRGEALQLAMPFVEEVYGSLPRGGSGRSASSSTGDRGSRAQRLGRVLHVTYHSIPEQRVMKCAVLFCAALVWILLYPFALKVRCVASAVVYTFVESAFTHFERGVACTSAAQFVGNLLYTPVLLDVHGWAFEGRPCLYVLLFTFNVWLLEVVVGFTIIWVHGHNVAWCYLDCADEFLNGCIRLGHGIWWLGLGCACYVGYPLLCNATAAR